VKNPFIIDTQRQRDIKRTQVHGFSRSKGEGTDAHWMLPGSDPVHQTTDTRRLAWISFLVVIVLFVFTVRVGYMQIVKGSEYRQTAEDNRIRIEAVVPPRGLIVDRRHEKLATNVADFQLTITPADLPTDQGERNAEFEMIASILHVSKEDIEQKLDEARDLDYQPVLIADHIPHEESVLLDIATKDLAGVEMRIASSRRYINDETYSHLIGYTGKVTREEYDTLLKEKKEYLFSDTIGKNGLEVWYESVLRGVMGKREIEVDALGNEKKIVSETAPISGNTVVLNIDHGLQQVAYEELMKELRSNRQATGGAAVAMDPRTGEVLALVSAPSFSNNEFIQGISTEKYSTLLSDAHHPLLFRAISGEYPSGSVIKPVIAAAALQENVINASTTFLSTGGIRIGEWFFPDWKAGGHGVTNVIKAIAESVNTFFYYVGGGDNSTFTGLGVDAIRMYAERFGLNAKLGIDVGGESTGFLPTKSWKEEVKHEQWYIGDTYHLAIGQGDLLVTPLQVASYTATIANGGTVYRPALVHQVEDQNGNLIQSFAPTVIRENVIDADNLATVREGMRQTVLSGSAQSLSSEPFSVAGKTGTAQFSSSGKTHAWFTSFAPYENPEIVVSVLVEEGGEGHDAALPIAREMLRWWYAHR
jgi:penicillin-binding protein 2